MQQPVSVPPFLLKVPEAAQALGIGKSLLYVLVREQRIRAVRVNNVLRFRPADLAEFADQLASETAEV